MLTHSNQDSDVECSECGRVYAANEMEGINRCPADDCPSNEWFCRACGCNAHECECNAEDMGTVAYGEDGDDDAFGHDGFTAQDPYDCEYDH